MQSEKDFQKMDDINGEERYGLAGRVENTTIIHSVGETPDEIFERLRHGLQNGTLKHKEIVDSVFNVVSSKN